MHELSIAREIIDIVRQYLPADGTARVRSVLLRVGEYAGIVPDSLEFCFTALIQDTPLRDASLRMERVPMRALCRLCGTESEVEFTRFHCSSCGGNDLQTTSGNELQVLEIELEEERNPIP